MSLQALYDIIIMSLKGLNILIVSYVILYQSLLELVYQTYTATSTLFLLLTFLVTLVLFLMRHFISVNQFFFSPDIQIKDNNVSQPVRH